MLIAAVALLPGGDPERARALGLVNIANVTPHEEIADYDVWDEYDRHASVKRHRRADGWLPLLARACEALDAAL